MVETRIAPRVRVNKSALLTFGGLKHPCRVRDISTTGAALEFAEPVRSFQLPANFTLTIPEDNLNLDCRAVWARDYRMGVAFA